MVLIIPFEKKPEMAVEVKGNLKKNNKTTVKAVKVTEESL
jgi:hypothetical protein